MIEFEVLGHIANYIALVSLYIRNTVALRCLVFASQGIFGLKFFYLSSKPWLVLVWNSFFMALTVYSIFQLITPLLKKWFINLNKK